jgi:hypothetical protein
MSETLIVVERLADSWKSNAILIDPANQSMAASTRGIALVFRV